MSIKNSATRLAAYAAGAAVTLALAGAVVALPAQAAGLNSSQIQSILSLLSSFGADQGTINNVQAALSGQATTGSTTTTTTTTTGGVCPYTWSTDLTIGSTGPDVMALQKFLNMSAATQVSATGNGAPGMETSYFGPATRTAVSKFQTINGITPTAGYFGPVSRAKASSLCTSGSTTTTTTGGTGTTTTGGNATVSAGAQPTNAIAPQGASRVPYTAFTVTANGSDVTLNNVTVMRQGPSLDTDFSGVTLVDANTGIQLGTSRVLDANHSATIGSTVVIPAGTSKTFWVVGNIAQVNGGIPGSGDVASFAVTAVNTNGTVSGSLPITGASNTINTALTIGSATIQTSSFDPNSASSQPIGTTGYRFTGLRIQAGSSEDETFKSITWYQSGSASGIQNVTTVVNGTSYPAVADSTGRYYTSVFPTGIVIPKGQSVDVYVQGDLGANTTANTFAEFDIYRNTDIYLTGNTYGFGITPTATPQGGTCSNISISAGTYCSGSSHTTLFLGGTQTPWIQGSTIGVTAGTFSTIQNATSVVAQNIAINVPNQPLGGFQTNLTGEAIQAQSIKVHFQTSGNLQPLQNVSLVDETGAVVSGPYNAVNTTDIGGLTTATAGTTDFQVVTFTGATNFPTGSHTYTIKGQVQTQPSINGVTVQASTNPSTDWTNVTGQTTGNTVQTGVTNFTMNTMTVKAGSLSVTNSSNVSNQSVVSGAQNFVFDQIQLDASQSGEDVRLSSLPLKLTVGGSPTGLVTDLSACQLMNGTTVLNTGSRIVNSANITGSTPNYTATFSFDNAITVPKGTVLTLSLTCNLSSAAQTGSTYAWGINDAGTYGATGVTSGSNITVTGANGALLSGNVGNAPVMIASTGGSMTLAVDSTSPSYNLAAGGTTGVTLGVFKLRATNENVNLTKVGISLGLGHASDLSNIYLYSSAGQLLGTAQFTGGTLSATSTLTTPLMLTANVDTTILVKGDLAAIGTNMSGVEGDLIQVNPASAEGNGISSGKTVMTGNNGSTVQGVTIYKTYPTVALGSLSSNGVAGDGQLIRFQVSANNAGSLGVEQFVFKIASSTGVSIGTPALYAYTDPNYSQPASGTNGGVVALTSFTYSNIVGVATTTITTPLEVPAGGSLYFLLKTPTVSYSGTANQYNVSATLLGDTTKLSSIAATNGTTLNASSSFVWSPNATSTVTVLGANDWTNGFGIIGLPSIGLTQNRTN